MKHLGYLLEACSREKERSILSDEKLSTILFAFEIMANAAERQVPPRQIDIPEITGYPSIQKEIEFLERELARKKDIRKVH